MRKEKQLWLDADWAREEKKARERPEKIFNIGCAGVITAMVGGGLALCAYDDPETAKEVLKQFGSLETLLSAGLGTVAGAGHAVYDHFKERFSLKSLLGGHIITGASSYLLSRLINNSHIIAYANAIIGVFTYHLSYDYSTRIMERYFPRED